MAGSLYAENLQMFERIRNFFRGKPQTAAVSPALPVAPAPTEQRNFSLRSEEAQRLLIFGGNTLSGVDVNNETILSVPPFYAAIRYISNGIAMLDREVKKKKKGGIFPAENHPLQVFFNTQPHPHYTWFDFMAALIANACFGNGYAYIHWDEITMRPLALEHIPQGMAWPEYDADGALWYRFSTNINGFGSSMLVPSTDMIHIKGFTTNAINGRSTAFIHQDSFGAAIASQQYASSIFGKSAHPSIAIKYDQDLSPAEAKKIEDDVMARHSGSDKAGRPLVLDSGMDIKYLQWSPHDVMYVDFRRFSAEEVSMITQVPLEMLLSNDKGTLGAAIQRSQNFLTHTLNPWIEKIQEEFNRKLFYQAEFVSRKRYFQFNTDMYVRLDKKTESDILVSLVEGKVLTPNEARKRMGLNPLPFGDSLYGDINSLPLKNLVDVATAKYLSAVGEKIKGEQDQQSMKDQGNKTTDIENEPQAQQ